MEFQLLKEARKSKILLYTAIDLRKKPKLPAQLAVLIVISLSPASHNCFLHKPQIRIILRRKTFRLEFHIYIFVFNFFQHKQKRYQRVLLIAHNINQIYIKYLNLLSMLEVYTRTQQTWFVLTFGCFLFIRPSVVFFWLYAWNYKAKSERIARPKQRQVERVVVIHWTLSFILSAPRPGW